MLKQTLTYQNFNGKNVTEVLWFNLTKADLISNIALVDEIEEMRISMFGDAKDPSEVEERELSNSEVSMLVAIVEKIVEIAYGKRSVDGLIHDKSPEVYRSFRYSAGYDAFVIGLFKEPDRMLKFIESLMPSEAIQQAKAEAAGEEPADATVTPIRETQDVELGDTGTAVLSAPDEPPAELTDEELLKKDPQTMSQSELMRAYKIKSTQ
jgi:hypothetical protein